jgi:hypothetical protein
MSSGAVLMNVIINTPPTQMSRRARADYACRALQLVIQELSHGGGNISSGDVVGQDSLGVPNQSLGYWGFDAHDP